MRREMDDGLKRETDDGVRQEMEDSARRKPGLTTAIFIGLLLGAALP